MPKLPYDPAKDCRHRVAAIALYRALIQTAKQIALPPTNFPNGECAHPVVHRVRARFRGNKDDRSLRLVYSSMTAGYKFLDMLHKAKAPESPEYQKIVGFIRKHEEKAQAREAQRRERIPPLDPTLNPSDGTRKPSKDYRTKPDSEFMIRNIAHPFEAPFYVGEARPLFSLKKRRRIPTLAAETYGFPFLRYGKPQPKGLDNMIRSHKMQWHETIYSLLPLEEHVAPTAQWEDVWEENLEKVRCEEEGIEAPRWEDMDPNPQSSYTWAVHVSRLWYELKLERLWQDSIARGKALERILNEEKRFQEIEDQQDGQEKPEESGKERWDGGKAAKISPAERNADLAMPMAPEGTDPALFASVMKQYGYQKTAATPPAIAHPPRVSKDNIAVMEPLRAQPAWSYWLRSIEAYKRDHNQQLPEVDRVDTFSNPLWALCVEFGDKRIRKHMSKLPNAGANARFQKYRHGRLMGVQPEADDESGSFVTYALGKAKGKEANSEW